MSDKNPFDDPDFGSETATTTASKNVFDDPEYGKDPGLARSIGDTAVAATSGVLTGAKLLANVAGANNSVAQGLGDASDYVRGFESAGRRAEREARANKIKTAEESGSAWEEIKANVGAFAEAPIDTTIEALGTSAPAIAATIATRGRAAPIAGGAVGGAQGAGSVKGSIYDAVEQAHIEAGDTPESAEAKATAAQAYGGENLGQIGLGAGLGAIAGSTGVESAIGRLVGREVGEEAAKGIVRSTATGALKEAPIEAAQGGQERLASNLALQNEGFDTGTWTGVAGSAALEGVAGGAAGGGTGLVEGILAPSPTNTAIAPEARSPLDDPAQPIEPVIDPTQPITPQPSEAQANQPTQVGSAYPSVDPAFRTETVGSAVAPQVPEPVTQSQAMGIDPAAGPMSSAAALAVDSGASQSIAEQSAIAAAQAEQAKSGNKADASKRQNPATNAMDQQPLFAASQSVNQAQPQNIDPDTGEILSDQSSPPPAPSIADQAQEIANRIKYIRQQASGSGWTPDLMKARVAAEAELARVNSLASEQPQTEIEDAAQTNQAQQASPQRAQAPIESAAQPASTNAGTSTAEAAEQSPSVAPDFDALGSQWGSMNAKQRKAIADKSSIKGVIKKNIHKADWQTMGVAAKAKLAEVMAPSQSSASAPQQVAQQNQTTTQEPASWVLKNKETGEVVAETFDRKKVDALNTEKYEAVPITQHLASLSSPQAAQPESLPTDSQIAPSDSQNGATDSVSTAPVAENTAIDSAAHQAATSPNNDRPEPTDAQKEAGNYAKGHIRVNGLDISIENPRGSQRKGVSDDGVEWSHNMSDHYGYIKRTKGADGEQVDVYVGSKEDAPIVYVVDQIDQKTGAFDEHKAMIGFDTEADAVAAYSSNFDDGWKVGKVRAMPMDEFKAWLADGDTTSPASDSQSPSVDEQASANREQEVSIDEQDESDGIDVDAENEQDDSGSGSDNSEIIQAVSEFLNGLSAKTAAKVPADIAEKIAVLRGLQSKHKAQLKNQGGLTQDQIDNAKDYVKGVDRAVDWLESSPDELKKIITDIESYFDKNAKKFKGGNLSLDERKDERVADDFLKMTPPRFGDESLARELRNLLLDKAPLQDQAASAQPKAKKPRGILAKKAEADAARAAEVAAAATHKDAGEPAEVATQSVVDEAVRKSASNTVLNLKEAKARLLAEVDAAIAAVPQDPASKDNRADFERLKSITSFGSKDAAKTHQEKVTEAAKKVGYVNFNVPGDGKFKVLNTAERLKSFRKKVQESPGFRELSKHSDGKNGGINETASTTATIREMIADGELSSAMTLAEISGKPIFLTPAPAGKKPNPYMSVTPTESFGLGHEFVVGQFVNANGKPGEWFVLSKNTGQSLGAGAATKAGAIDAASKRVKGLTQAQIDNLKQKIAATPAISQVELAEQWTGEKAYTGDEPSAESDSKPEDAGLDQEIAAALGWTDDQQKSDAAQASNEDAKTEAKPKPKQADPESKTPKLDQHVDFMKRVRNGDATPEEYQAAFAATEEGIADIKGELKTMKKDDLLRSGGAFFYQRHRDEKKDQIIDSLARKILDEYSLGRSYGPNSYVMSASGIAKRDAERAQALRDLVANTTADDLSSFAAEVAEARQEAKDRRAAKEAAIADPKTLDDYRQLVRHNQDVHGESWGEAFMRLTPEQRIRFDELEAERTKDARDKAKQQAKSKVATAGQTTTGEIIATKHTKHGHDLYVVQLNERVSREDYDTLNASAKRLGGSYSSYRGNGAIPGFQFRAREGAEAFSKLVAGDTADAQALSEARRDAFADDRSQSAVERLRTMSAALNERADESLGRDRKVNTNRRAGIADRAEAAANHDKALAGTMSNLAAAIEKGDAKFLDAVRQKVQVEFLTSELRTAKDAQLRAKYPSYSEQEKHRGEPVDAETVDYSTFPSYTAMRSDLADLGRKMLDVDGTKKLGARLMNVADDVTDAYTTWAKDNLLLVSRFGRGDQMADFANKDSAEKALRRSGLTGRAIVLPVKRGQNRIVLAPSEAMKLGLWSGDGDKRITLSNDFGNELVQALGRRAGDKVRIPWQLQSAHDKLKRLEGMGIATGSEYRSALREFANLRETAAEPDKIKKMERAMIGRRNDGLDFFPTSESVIDTMLEAAEIQDGMSVLEPSAGMGHIADAIRDKAGVDPDVVELSGDRRELLEAKGFNLIGSDFMELKPREFFTFGDVFRAPDGTVGVMRGQGGLGSNRVRLQPLDENGTPDDRRSQFVDRDTLVGVEHRGSDSGYDRIIMNPPFSKGRDIQHVKHAYDLLKPGGKLVAIMGEGAFFQSNKAAEDFRQWLDDLGATNEKLPDNSFMDSSLPVNTGVNARMVVIEKPENSASNNDGVSFSRSGRKDVTQTDEFKNWFGDSKVVDDQGKPLVVYHGTGNSFGVFSLDAAGKNTDSGMMGTGFYFASSPEEAARYARGTAPNVVPVYLSLKRPFEADNYKDFPSIPQPQTMDEMSQADNLYSQQLRDKLVSDGYDGVIFTRKDGSKEYVAFQSEQIKSATGNNGQFDPSDPNISHSFAGRKAQGADIASLAVAQRRIASGQDPEQARQATGWHRGADGKWRYEISDNAAVVIPEGSNFASIRSSAMIDKGNNYLTVGDVLEHDKLYAAYPELRDLPLEIVPESDRSTAKFIRTADGGKVQVSPRVPRDKLASAMLHELQHAIQATEGFARGGSKASAQSLSEHGADAYKRLAGEVEARNTQARMLMDDRFRQMVSPDETADVAADDVIVTFNGRDVVRVRAPSNLSAKGLVDAFDAKFPSLTPAVRKMLARGNKGERGGVVMIESDDPVTIAKVFSTKTGRKFSDAVEMFQDDGVINGFYDPKSGLTFLVGPNLDANDAPAVLLHEMIHGQQRKKVDQAALSMIMNRAKEGDDLRSFLDRVAARMVDAGEAANAQEAAAYIVEQAVIEGRSQGYTFADSRFLDWVDSNISKKVGNVIRSILASVRQFMLRNGMSIGGKISVDDLVAYAQAGIERAAQGNVAGGDVSFSRDSVTNTPAFKRWFGDSKVMDSNGNPLVVYHGSPDVRGIFSEGFRPSFVRGSVFFAARDYEVADSYADHSRAFDYQNSEPQTIPLYLSIENPLIVNANGKHWKETERYIDEAKAEGHDGIIIKNSVDYYNNTKNSKPTTVYAWFEPSQAKSAVTDQLRSRIDRQPIAGATANNGQFDPASNDIRFSRSAIKGYTQKAVDELNKTFSAPGKLSKWHTTVGTMYNLAKRSAAFKPVFESAQGFIEDVAYYAADAAELAPKLLPRLETWKDIAKSPVSAEDNKAVSKPIFEGTLVWARDLSGAPIRVEDLAANAEKMTTEQKAEILIATDKVAPGIIKAWRALGDDKFAENVDSRYESQMLKPGIVWTDGELRRIFNLTDGQIELYREFRSSTDRSLDTMARSDMLRYGGDDVKELREAVMDVDNVQQAAQLLRSHLLMLSKVEPDRADQLMVMAKGMTDRAEKVAQLQGEGYAPLSRFGKYTVDVVVNGERQYFGLFETARDANRMKDQMEKEFGAGNVSQGTLSDEAYKMFAGVTPESLELFGSMLGLNATGDEAQDKAFQEYLRLTKTNRSAMRRLIHRQGIAGYSEDVSRVLASFVYSNARMTAAGLHMGDLGEAITAIPKEQGELKDAAIRLGEYIKNPQEEAQAMRGLLFAQYLGGSVASAFVNMTQPFAVTFPWLSQYGGAKKAAAEIGRAAKNMSTKGYQYEPDLAKALKDAEDDGVVSPQEVHQLMAQARGSGSLRSGDGTRAGDARAMTGNAMARLSVAWGKLFGAAEQVNRRITFIASYRMAVDRGMENPAEFASEAVKETQFIYSKASKMQWGRGAVGGTLMTFKTYSVAYLELMSRLWSQGEAGSQERKDGRKAAALMVGMLMLMGGAGGIPFAEDAEDLIDGAAQLMGYNLSAKKAKEQFLVDLFGEAAGRFIDKGLSGLPGAPLDVSGRLGMGNLIPGTGLFQERTDHSRDILEIAGPAGDMAKRFLTGGRQILGGDIGAGLLEMSPTAVRNAVKGIDMGATGMYRDTKGYKVLDTNHLEAALKAIGFQPNNVARVQEANWLNQRSKAFYNQKAQEIRQLWATGLFEKDAAKVQQARDAVADWNSKNPDQPMIIKMPDIARRVREMNKSKDQRIADTAPRAMRAQMREDAARLRADLTE